MGPSPRAEPSWLASWRARARQLKQETYMLYLAYRDPRVPWWAKLFTALVVAYAFSPIDLIPDFIPVLGYLDDLVLVPLGVALAIRMIPPDVLEEKRAAAQDYFNQDRPRSWTAAVLIGLIWLAGLAWLGMLLVQYLQK